MTVLLVLLTAPFVVMAAFVMILLRSVAGLDDEFQPRRPARP